MSGIHMMLMASGGKSVEITNHSINVNAFALSPSNASCAAHLNFNNNGTLSWQTTQSPGSGSSGSYAGEWLIAGNAADYEVFATVLSGALSGGTTGSWLNLGSTRNFNCSATRTTVGTTETSASVEFQIRHVSGTVQDVATIGLSATASKEN